ncbi:TetR/AcrR family transcriptional regulator [Amycolatopsis sp. NPDC058278]|jgi:AcrR family transcriptional regulator|uniref:TetR/AcrR family transcriptional regulator n=1 Tax=Amycolatopsis sp. NPDC058278 TaxID=3346417 RepID=UPI0036DAC1A6
MGERAASGTKDRILAIAKQLFLEKGYAGTSIADISGALGTTKAAVYYHFAAKDAILSELLAKPLAEYTRLAERAVTEPLTAAELLGELIDMTADAESVLSLPGNDPSISAELKDMHKLREKNDMIIAGLADPGATGVQLVRAHAAYAVAKQGTFAVLAANGGKLPEGARAELLDAALRALGH